MKACSHEDLYAGNSPTLETATCPSTGDWMDQLECHIRVEDYSARDVDQLLTHKTTWVSLEIVPSAGRVTSDLSCRRQCVSDVQGGLNQSDSRETVSLENRCSRPGGEDEHGAGTVTGSP